MKKFINGTIQISGLKKIYLDLIRTLQKVSSGETTNFEQDQKVCETLSRLRFVKIEDDTLEFLMEHLYRDHESTQELSSEKQTIKQFPIY